jgi:predicted RecB family nuclease
MKKNNSHVIYSPSDLIRYFSSPFASWMDRYHLENPRTLTPDEQSEDQKLIIETGIQHETTILGEFTSSVADMVEIRQGDPDPVAATVAAIHANAPIIYQAALADERFAGFADFIILDETGKYQIWDTKLARSPKPSYAIQLCCYSEMFAATSGLTMPEKFGIILGTEDRVEFRVEDFIHYYRHIRQSFLALQDGFTGNMDDCPEPSSGVDHGRWTSYAEKYFHDTDHLVRVAGISSGQIKKLKKAGINTVAELVGAAGISVPKLAAETLEKLVAQASLQNQTLADRAGDGNALARYEVLLNANALAPVGLAALPEADAGDVFFDMEGFPIIPGGLEYLWGACTVNAETGSLDFHDWWAHDREEEKFAFERFIDWVYERWLQNPKMHIYHYAAYEVSAVRRLSTRHDTRQDEVDNLLRHEVFVDLYKIVRQGLRIGEESYSIKKVERLYRPPRVTDVVSGAESIVQYARWIESNQPRQWQESPILKDIRDYNEDDCSSTEGLFRWLKVVAEENHISAMPLGVELEKTAEPKELDPGIAKALEIVGQLREREDEVSTVLADIVGFHRREEKPMWWRMFDRAGATPDELRDDAGCIQGVEAVGAPAPEKQSQLLTYRFDPSQECKLAAGERSRVMFCHNLNAKFTLADLDISVGGLTLKISNKALTEKFGGDPPAAGALIPDEFVSAKPIPQALVEVAASHLGAGLPSSAAALLERLAPGKIDVAEETFVERAIRVAASMSGGCFVIQGPPGTGKTYTAARVINSLVAAGKRVGVSSNSHKAVINLLIACGDAMREMGGSLNGIKVGGDSDGPLYDSNPYFHYIKDSGSALDAYSGGVVGGTAWLFTRDEWENELDYLFIDEAGQVSLANTLAMSRCAQNIVLLGDQMQLEQPVQGAHPGDAGLSGLQYALKDPEESREDLPIFHAVVPPDYGLFLGESRRMHPAVCEFISESIYEGRLESFADCAKQRIAFPDGSAVLISKENGIVLSGVEHEGNIQQSDEEVDRVVAILNEMLCRNYTATDGGIRPLELEDFLIIAPYNAQVRALQAALPNGARVGSVDKFQGQEAPVCILSLCSSFGEYGSRGLGFILDRNRINVAISRAQCLAVVVGDPRIAGTSVNSLYDMRLLSLYCKLITPGS